VLNLANGHKNRNYIRIGKKNESRSGHNPPALGPLRGILVDSDLGFPKDRFASTYS
jgi:hypothetical protein